MAVQLTTDRTHEYQKHFSKRFLKTLQETIVYEQFAVKEPLPQGEGSDTVRFFIDPDGNADDVIALAENTVENTTFSSLDLGYIDVQLDYWGDKQKISNRLSLTSFFDRLKKSTKKMSLSAAYYCDRLMRNELVTAQDQAGYRRYAGGATSFNALVALTAANSSWTPMLGLAAVTKLRIGKATPAEGDKGKENEAAMGNFVTVVPPEIAFDLVQHAKWEEPAKYAGSTQIFKRELGRLWGTRYIEATNPFREAATDDTQGTFAADGAIYSVVTLGEEAFGFVDLKGGNSPFRPKMTILDKADKSDPHNQFTVVAYAAYGKAKALSKSRYVVTRCKTTFV